MQVGLCCSPLQRQFARSLAVRLQRNLGVATLIVEATASAPVSAVWEQAAASSAVLLLLDSVSAPGPAVNRRDWESLLEHTGAPPVALLRLESCSYPKLLERRRFLSPASAVEAERWVERWLVELLLPRDEAGIEAAPVSAAAPHEWWTQLVDRPGVCMAAAEDADAAQAFAREARRHFQGTFWIGCEHRPAAAIQDELAHWSRGATRLLFTMVHHSGAPLDVPAAGGAHSYLVLEGTPAMADSSGEMARWVGVCQASAFPGAMMDLMLGRGEPEWEALVTVLDRERRLYRPHGRLLTNRRARQRHLEVLEAAFRGWRLQALLCRELLAEAAAALRYGFECHSPSARNLCLELALFLLSEKRNSEAVGWLRVLVEEAERESDFAMGRRARSELQWLVDDVGAPLPEVVEVGEQLGFDWNA